MSALLSLVVLLAVPDAAYVPSAGAASTGASPSVRAGRELEQAVHAALRRWAKRSMDEAEPAAREFLALYQDCCCDTALPRTVRQELAVQLRIRLAALARQIGKQAAVAKQHAGPPPASVHRDRQGDVLAQQGGGAAQPRGGPAFGGRAPGGGFAPSAAADRDAGEELVELIQAVISPMSWERMGGPGTIRYWPPGRAVVARASGDVHDQMAELTELMQQLER